MFDETRLSDPAFAERLLDVIEHDVVPLTRAGVERGNKIFGAAILRKDDLSLVIAETNNETANPLWHGEMHALKRLYERDRAQVPDPRDCLFLATHEPCSLCLSAITWAGYDNFFHLFSHADSRDRFAIPHDIRILKEVYAPPGRREDAPLYNRRNAFWHAYSIPELVAGLPPGPRERLGGRIEGLAAIYAELSGRFQAVKDEALIPFS